MLKNNKYNLLVLGDGELRKKLFLLAKKLGISNNVHLIGNVENVYKYIKKSLCVISTSLWEDPGFVMIESAISRKIIISSDCPNGPQEFIGKDEAGYIFKSNNVSELTYKINFFLKDTQENIKLKKFNAIKKSREYSLFQHFISLKKNI